ncbi:C-X-C chemokine receptor type 3.1 [Dunckerocampus dactyliophorus]|uniref:C-X-C chemokine receptor type 3.1 n=1 Tax=Dunckerocampus dactyliophorus TaxID=161453 RepID=UPI0024066B55|nr:C-X-C chemokine receptor type 3.1 [Dunckerocampus dactyliophorus]
MSANFNLASLLESGEAVTFDMDDWLFDGIDLHEANNSEPNNLTSSVCDLKEGRQFEAVFIPVLYSVALVVGIPGNGVLLGVLARSRKSWSVTDTFILHLAIADVLLLITLPLWTAQDAQGAGWTFGTPLCKITGSVFTINFYCGIFLLACISLDRYLSIVHATQMYSRRKPHLIQASCLAVWLLSLFLSVPDWIFLEAVKDARRDKTECIRNVSESWHLASRLLYHVAGFLLPSLVLVYCYSCILQRLRCGSQGLQKQKAFRVIAAVVVVFFLCWVPYNLTLMVDTAFAGDKSCEFRASLGKAMIITPTIGYLHCSLNPILYAFVGVKFRRQLLDILRALVCKPKQSVKLQSAVSSRRSSLWSDSGDTSNSLVI